MKIILHGILAERFGREFQIATDVPAEAMEGLSRQLPDWPRDVRVSCVGFNTEEKLRSPTEAKEIHLMPTMYGGGGKFTTIIIGAVVTAIGIGLEFVPGMQAIGTDLIIMGAGMMLSGVAQLFMKAPTVDKSSDPPASKYLGNNKNTVAIGTLITMAWGRVKLAGQWLSIQVDSSDLVTTSFPATTS